MHKVKAGEKVTQPRLLCYLFLGLWEKHVLILSNQKKKKEEEEELSLMKTQLGCKSVQDPLGLAEAHLTSAPVVLLGI